MRGLILLFLCIIALTLAAQPERVVADRLFYINKPIQVLSASSDTTDNRLYIACHDGNVWIYENGQLNPVPFLNLGAGGMDIIHFGTGSEQGLNGFIFDPDFPENGICYAMYNGVRPDGTGQEVEQRLMAFKRSEENPDVIDPTQWYELMEFDEGDDPEDGHNGGQLAYGNDGYLYLSCGDGGSTGTGAPGGGSNGDNHGEFGNGQNLKTFLGKILRIETHGLAPYTVPEDNPFVGDTSAWDEIWAYGFRNPWRFSIDHETGDLFVGDVGEVDWEEISRIPAGVGGLNMGWRLMEGSHCYEPVEDCDPDNETTLPIFDYHHSNGLCATVGGVVYRGSNLPYLQGYLIVGDFCGFYDIKFWIMSGEGDSWSAQPFEIVVQGGFVPWGENSFGFGEDNKNEVYLCTSIAVYKLAWNPDEGLPQKDGEVHIFPNPAQGQMVLDLGEDDDINEITVWDQSGRVVMQYDQPNLVRTARFDVSSMAPGAYLIRVVYDGNSQVTTQKFTVR